MVSHADDAATPTAAGRTWRPWRAAWVEAAYAADGFWSTQQPHRHFATAVRAGPLVARAVAGLAAPETQVLVDVGAGDGALLSALAAGLPGGALVGAALVGVDRRPRPAGLDPRVRWVTDHWDVEDERWTQGGPAAWTDADARPLLVAHEWLDDLPVPVVERHDGGRDARDWREVEVDRDGHERPGGAVGPDDRAWLDRWWPEGRRAEVGRSRDEAWAALVRAAVEQGGRALAVDYGHRSRERPVGGTLTAYGRGRRRTPVPDGTVNLTAGVAVDALAAAGQHAGAATLLLERQAGVLGRVAREPGDELEALVRRSERAALTAPERWGDLWWLLQGAP